MNKIIILTLITGFIFLSACSKKKDSTQSEPYIVTTTGMIADLVRNLTGASYRVEGLMGPGIDPHLYKTSQGDINKLSDADIIFYNGLHLEGKMTEILEKMGRSKNVIAISKDIEETYLITLEGASNAYDPHIWFDVSMWRMSIPTILKALIKTFPKDQEIFERNAQTMDSILINLHQWVVDEVSTVPEDRRIMITAHDAFEYFGKAYGINVHGLQGVSTVAEYGVHDVNRMVDLILEKNIRAVFVETSVPKRSIEAVMAGVRAKNGEVQIGGNLYSDAMGAVGSGADTYQGMVRTNVLTIVDALK